MAWGLRGYLVGCVGLGVLGVLAACSGGFFAEREPWRHEAEAQCINSGAVKESAAVARVNAIRGPGTCGADFPLRVSALGETSTLGYSDELRPPGTIPGGAAQPRWPVAPAGGPPPRAMLRYDPAPPDRPISLSPYGDPPGGPPEPYDVRRPAGASASPPAPPPRSRMPREANPPVYDFSPEPYERRRVIDGSGYEPPAARGRAVRVEPLQPADAARMPMREPPPLGPARGTAVTGSLGAVSMNPPATLACPMVSALEQWVANDVQPSALRWFGSPVVEIKQISAYSCRGMNGNRHARISEHAFGNALDIASFTLADGRKITVKNGWRGLPEEQGFLRDVQGAACEQFNTVLAPGSNIYHYDHFHVDLMRRSGGRRACNPDAVPGEVVAARAGGRFAVRRPGEPSVTGSLASRRPPPKRWPADDVDDGRQSALPLAQPGEDGLDDD